MNPPAASQPGRPRPQPVPTPALSAHTFKKLNDCRSLEEAFQTKEFLDRIAASVPQHMQPNRMLRTFVSAVQKAPLLAKADLKSFVGACLTCSQVGLEPNTPLQHAFLIPFKNRRWNPQTRQRDIETVEINLIFGYPGLLDLSYRSGEVTSVHADVVWRSDEFSFEYGSNAHLRHKPTGQRGEGESPIAAYMHASLRGGQAFEVLPWPEVLRIRNRSQAYRMALAAREEAESKGRRLPPAWTEAPWVAHEIAMARKTAFRSGSKWLPRSVEMASAIALDEAQERRRSMDFGPVLDTQTIDGTADYLGTAADLASRPEEDEPPEPTVTRGVTRGHTPAPEAPEPAWEDQLFDEVGDAVDTFSDPVKWARAFDDLMENTSNIPLALENNDGPLASARAASAEASNIIDNVLEKWMPGWGTAPKAAEEKPTEAAASPPPDDDLTKAEAIIGDLRLMTRRDHIERYAARHRAFMTALRRGNPSLFKRVDDAFGNALRQAEPGPPPPPEGGR
jgi:recombination protein RecT